MIQWVFVLVVSAFVQGASPVDTLREANDAYARGEYAAAVTLYESLLESGVSDAVVYFNLGLSYYRQDDLGSALVNLRRAQRIAPRDDAVGQAIAQVRGERADLQFGEASWLDVIAMSTVSSATQRELTIAVLSMWLVWFGLATAYAVQQRWRRLRPLLIGLGIVLFIGMTLLFSRVYVEAERPAAVVLPLSVQVMSGPGEDYLELYRLYAAAELRVLETHDDWARFVLPDGRQGWVERDNIELI